MKNNDLDSHYRIGIVAKLTGIQVDTIRVWERRYQVVSPKRTANQARLYSQQDVEKLIAIKHLLDAGDSIGEVAKLSLADIQRRADALTNLPVVSSQTQATITVIALGPILALKLAKSPSKIGAIKLAAVCKTVEEFEQQSTAVNADVIVLEFQTLDSHSHQQVSQLMSTASASLAVIIYEFASSDVVQQLNNQHCITHQGSLNTRQLADIIHHQFTQGKTDQSPTAIRLGEISRRRFTDANLVSLSTVNTTIKCECPHHLAEILFKLNAFEKYSLECENRTAKDATLHAYLHHATAKARAIMEDALTQVVEEEGITL